MALMKTTLPDYIQMIEVLHTGNQKTYKEKQIHLISVNDVYYLNGLIDKRLYIKANSLLIDRINNV